MQQRRPAFHHYLAAYTGRISVIIGVSGSWAGLLFLLHAQGVEFWHVDLVPWVLLVAVPTAGLGLIGSGVFLWTILGSIAAKLQGWPFKNGERVWILTGKHKNSVATIYEIWHERRQVRLDLGPEEKTKVEDVYHAVSICRAEPDR